MFIRAVIMADVDWSVVGSQPECVPKRQNNQLTYSKDVVIWQKCEKNVLVTENLEMGH